MQRFRSEVSVGLLGLLVVALFLPLGVTTFIVTPRADARPALLAAGGIHALVVVFVVWMYATTDYRVEGDELRIRSGPFRWRVNLPSVRRLRATRSPLSAPALSLNRIEIEYGRFATVLVSPADRQGFIRAVLARAPNAALQGLDDDR